MRDCGWVEECVEGLWLGRGTYAGIVAGLMNLWRNCGWVEECVEGLWLGRGTFGGIEAGRGTCEGIVAG